MILSYFLEISWYIGRIVRCRLLLFPIHLMWHILYLVVYQCLFGAFFLVYWQKRQTTRVYCNISELSLFLLHCCLWHRKSRSIYLKNAFLFTCLFPVWQPTMETCHLSNWHNSTDFPIAQIHCLWSLLILQSIYCCICVLSFLERKGEINFIIII